MSIEEFKTMVCRLRKIRHAYQKLRLVGGEPLLHPDILEILRIAGAELKNKKIELYTNGLILAREQEHGFVESFAQICRQYGIRVIVTLYPIDVNYDKVIGNLKKNSVDVSQIGNGGRDKLFTLMHLDPKKNGKRSKYYICSETGCMQLVGNKIYPCSESAYVGFVNDRFGFDFRHDATDYIRIEDIKHFYSLWWFRIKSKSFCRYCVFPRECLTWGPSQHSAWEWVKRIR